MGYVNPLLDVPACEMPYAVVRAMSTGGVRPTNGAAVTVEFGRGVLKKGAMSPMMLTHCLAQRSTDGVQPRADVPTTGLT